MKKYLFVLLSALVSAPVFCVEKIYVSPTGSDKSGAGTSEKPYASFARAFEKFKSAKSGEFEIVIGAGEYRFDESVYIPGWATKNKKLLIEGKNSPDGKKPIFTGSKKISAKALKRVTDKSILARLPQEAKGTLYSLNLKEFGLNEYGEVKQRGFGGQHPPLEMEAFFNLSPMKPAQYPNGLSLLPIGDVLDRGTVLRNAAGPSAPKPEKDGNIRGATFKYNFSRPDRWLEADDAFAKGNFSVGWAYDQIKIKKIDAKAKTITLESPHVYGVYSNYPPKNSKWIDRADLRVRGYQVFNLIEELDLPEEYYIDRKNGIFYVLCQSAPKDSDSYNFSFQTAPLLNFNNAENVTLKNIDFAASRGAPLYVRNSRNITVDGCDFHGFGNTLTITGTTYKKKEESASDDYAKNNKVSNCRIYDNALGGLTIDGGNKRLLLSSESLVDNCEFFNNARRKPLVTPTLHVSGVGVCVANCYFHDHPHQTLLHTGNNLIIERNVFVNCCQNASDMGVIYTYSNNLNLGNVIRYNFFSDNLANAGDTHSTVAGVYMDEASAGMLVEKNIFCRTGSMGGAPAFGAIYIHGGAQTHANENIFIECESAFGCQTWSNKRYAVNIDSEANWRKTHIDVDSGIYPKAYPKLYTILDTEAPRLNYAESNKIYNSSMAMNGDLILRYNKWLRLNKNANVANLSKIKKWSLEDVKKFFGDDPLVKHILSVPMGLKK